MKLEINHHAYELLLTEEQCVAFFKLQTVQDLVVYLQSICNIAEEIKTLSIDEQEIELSTEGLQLPLQQVQALLPLLTLQKLQRLPVELVAQISSYTDAKTVHTLLSLPSRIKPPAMNNYFGSELGKQIITAHFQVDESLWKSFEQFTQKEQAAGKISTFATWFQNGDLKTFLALINVKNQTPPHMNDGFFLKWVTIFGSSVMTTYQNIAIATLEQKILYALVAPTNLIVPRIFTEILTAESSAVANYSSLVESLQLTQKIMQVKNNAAELDQIKATLRDRQFTYINFASMEFYGANLQGANLCGVNLCGADLTYANLCGANLEGVTLENAALSGTNLNSAILSDAYLYNMYLIDANLTDADLSNANLSYADLSYANLSYANLRAADLSHAVVADANLSGANLEDTNLYAITWGDQMVNFPKFQHTNLAGVQMDFSVFNTLPIAEVKKSTLLNGIQIKTLTFLRQQIARAKTLKEVDAIMQNNRDGILYLAHKSQPDVTPAIGKFFPSTTERLPNSAREFEVAIATRKAELKINNHAAPSASPTKQEDGGINREEETALETTKISSISKKRKTSDELPQMVQVNKKAKAAEVASESSESDVDDASLSSSSSPSPLQPF